MKFFTENRLIFVSPTPGETPPVATAPAVETPVGPTSPDASLVPVPSTPGVEVESQEAARGRESGAVEGARDAGKDRETVKASLSLVALRASNKDDFNSLTSASGLRDQKFEGPLGVDLATGKVNLARVKDDLFGRVKALVEKGDTGRLTKLIQKADPTVKPEDVIAVVSDIYATGLAKRVKSDFEKKYSRIVEFVKDKLPPQFTSEATIDAFGNLKVSYKSNPDTFDKNYTDYVANNKKPEGDEETVNQVTEEDRKNAALIKKSPIVGMILTIFSSIPFLGESLPRDENGKISDEVYNDIAAGNYPMIGTALGFFNSKNLVRGNHYEEFVNGLDPKQKSLVASLKAKVAKLPGANLGKLDEKAAGLAATIGSFLGVDKLKGLFGGDGSVEMPSAGAKLKKDFLAGAFGGEGLLAKLGEGAKLVIPNGSTLNLDGEADISPVGAAKTILGKAGKTLKIMPPISKNTLFKGDIDFSWIDKLS
jgi:hypothetical protein